MPATTQQLYALYVQSSREIQEGVTRAQWIVMPQRPTVYREGPARKELHDVGVVVFHRIQRTLRHRAVWKAESWGSHAQASAQLNSALDERRLRGSTISPMIVVPVTIEELDDALLDRSTPYSILNRIKKVALRNHHIEIK